MSAHIDIPEEPSDRSSESSWQERWSERLREIREAEGDDRPHEAQIPQEDLPRLEPQAPKAIDARRRVQEEVDRARAEMEKLVREAAAIEAAAARESDALTKREPEPEHPAPTELRPEEKTYAGGSPEPAEGASAAVSRLEAAIGRANQAVADVDAARRRAETATESAEAAARRAEEAQARAEAATRTAASTLERADALTQQAESTMQKAQATMQRAEEAGAKAEQAASRAEQITASAEIAVQRAEDRLGEMLDALLIDLRSIGDQLAS